MRATYHELLRHVPISRLGRYSRYPANLSIWGPKYLISCVSACDYWSSPPIRYSHWTSLHWLMPLCWNRTKLSLTWQFVFPTNKSNPKCSKRHHLEHYNTEKFFKTLGAPNTSGKSDPQTPYFAPPLQPFGRKRLPLGKS